MIENNLALNDVAMSGTMDLVNQQLTLTGEITINGRIMLHEDPEVSSAIPVVVLAQGVTLEGDGSIVLDARSNSQKNFQTDSKSKVVIGSGISVTGKGDIEADFINHGLISADQSGEQLVVTARFPDPLGSRSINHGRIEAVNGAELILSAMPQSTNGVISADGVGSVVRVDGQVVSGTVESHNGGCILIVRPTAFMEVNQQAHIKVENAGLLHLRGDKLPAMNSGLIEINPSNSTGGGTLTWGGAGLPNPSTLEGEGVIRLMSPGGQAELYQHPLWSCALGPDQRLEGIGRINMNLVSHGVIAPGLGIGTMFATRPIEFANDAQLEIEISTTSSDTFESEDELSLGGELIIRYSEDPSNFDQYWARAVVSADQITGRFDSVVAPTASGDLVTRVYYTEHEVIVGQSCLSDLNLDAQLDFVDIQLFLDGFIQQSPDADFNNDLNWDFIDISIFLESFSVGCMDSGH